MVSRSNAVKAKPFIEALVEYNQADTMLQIYERVRPGDDGRIRTVLSPGATNTGRFGASGSFLEPSTNLQNIPKKTAKRNPAYNVREVLCPSDGMVLVEGDLSAAERRLLAYLANERNAIRQIQQGINSYKWFAGQMFKISDWESISKSDPIYHIGKMSVLALDRGVSWKTLKEQINGSADLTGATITPSRAKDAVQLFHNLYPGYAKYYMKIGEELKNKGYLINICGRKRHFFGRVRSQAEWEAKVREGVSFQAQAIGDIINSRIIQIYNAHDPDLLRLLLQVHDAVLWETEPHNLKRSVKVVKHYLEQPIKLPNRDIVIPAEFSYSRSSWGEMRDLI